MKSQTIDNIILALHEYEWKMECVNEPNWENLVKQICDAIDDDKNKKQMINRILKEQDK